jgi:outer membrane receptor for ferrienterochelin and colicins
MPVAYANVYFPALKIGGVTDSLGSCEIEKIPSGNQLIKISFIGYFEQQKNIELKNAVEILDIELKSDGNSLNEVVITGNMKEVGKSQSVVPVEIYTAKFFEKNPSPSLFDALQNVNGVRPQLQCSVCNTGDIHINGMEGPYTMVLIDGMPIVSGLSTVYGLSGIPSGILQRLEVVKGPAAALYGSEAMGGIINVITKDPKNVSKLALDLNLTSYQEFNADVATGFKIGQQVSGLLSANLFSFDKRFDINHDNFTDVTLAKRLSLFNKWKFTRKNSEKQANLAFRYIYEDRFGGELNWNKTFRGGDSIYGESITTNRWEVIGSYDLPIEKEKITLHYSANRHQQDSYYGNIKYNADQIIGFTQLVWDKKWGKMHDYLFGISARYTFYDDNTPITATLDQNNAPQKQLLAGIFMQDEIKMGTQWKWLIGARYDYSNIHKHIASPRIGMKWTSKDNFTALRASTGNGFRVVNVFSEDHAALTGGRVIEFQGELKPEKSWNGNLNLTHFKSTSFGFLNIDASVFYTYFNNRIVADYLTDAEKIIYANLKGYAENYGASLNLDFSFTSGLKATLGGTFVNSFLYDDQNRQTQAIQTPHFTGNYSSSYHWVRYDVTIDLTGSVTSPMLLPILPNDFRPAKSPFFNITNLQATKRWKKWEIYGGIKNLFNFFPKVAPIMRPFDPFDKQANDPVNNPNGYTFDPSYNYAPIQKARGFLGVRIKI